MKLFNLFSKKKSVEDISFGIVDHNGNMTLENNFNGVIENPAWEDVLDYIDAMLADEQEFVTITLPEAMNGVRYMQACRVSDGISVQLGLEQGSKTKLVEKLCSEELAIEYLNAFYHHSTVNDADAFSPVQF